MLVEDDTKSRCQIKSLGLILPPLEMKKLVLFLCIVSITAILSGQEFRISIAPTFSNVYHTKYVKSSPYGATDFGYTGNLDFMFVTNRKVDFGIGLGYQISQVIIWIPDLSYFTPDHERIDLFIISFKSKVKLPNKFYLSLDPSFDKQVNYDRYHVADNQTGLGLSIGFGKNFRMSNGLLFNIEPRLWLHNLVPYYDLDRPFMLAVAGVNFGLVFGQKFSH